MLPVLANSDSVVVYNLGPGFGLDDAYLGTAGNLRSVTAISGSKITLSPNVAFPHESPAYRFQVVEQAVSYVCTPNASTPALGTLRRHSGYSITPAQPTAFSNGSSALLANDVAGC